MQRPWDKNNIVFLLFKLNLKYFGWKFYHHGMLCLVLNFQGCFWQAGLHHFPREVRRFPHDLKEKFILLLSIVARSNFFLFSNYQTSLRLELQYMLHIRCSPSLLPQRLHQLHFQLVISRYFYDLESKNHHMGENTFNLWNLVQILLFPAAAINGIVSPYFGSSLLWWIWCL